MYLLDLIKSMSIIIVVDQNDSADQISIDVLKCSYLLIYIRLVLDLMTKAVTNYNSQAISPYLFKHGC